MLDNAGLAGKIVVLDEVHADDVDMSQFLYEALSVGRPMPACRCWSCRQHRREPPAPNWPAPTCRAHLRIRDVDRLPVVNEDGARAERLRRRQPTVVCDENQHDVAS